MFQVIVLVLFYISCVSAASCDNGCSGHGTCGQNGICSCYDNWGVGLGRDSGDCSDRICPFEFAWVDKPDDLGNHHKYAECSNRGICDRETGECECFPGYEGKACARTSCPNDCSGHGRCMSIENMPFQVTPHQFKTEDFFDQYAKIFSDSYYKWDAGKTMGCVCDPEYTDADCSKRMCQFGNDIMDQRNNLDIERKFHVQHILLESDGGSVYGQSAGSLGGGNDLGSLSGDTFALTFTSKLNESYTTIPIKFPASTSAGLSSFVKHVENALESLPNKVIDDVHVAAAWATTHGYDEIYTTNTDANNVPSSDTGLYINITFTGEYVQGPQNLLTVKHYKCGEGCTPQLTGLELLPGSMNVSDMSLNGQGRVTDYNSYECGRRGKCDYSTGICECFSGYTGLACGTITSLV